MEGYEGTASMDQANIRARKVRTLYEVALRAFIDHRLVMTQADVSDLPVSIQRDIFLEWGKMLQERLASAEQMRRSVSLDRMRTTKRRLSFSSRSSSPPSDFEPPSLGDSDWEEIPSPNKRPRIELWYDSDQEDSDWQYAEEERQERLALSEAPVSRTG